MARFYITAHMILKVKEKKEKKSCDAQFAKYYEEPYARHLFKVDVVCLHIFIKHTNLRVLYTNKHKIERKKAMSVENETQYYTRVNNLFTKLYVPISLIKNSM
jgi:hypothetical protein